MCAQSLCRVQLFATPWTVAYQVPLSMEFPSQEYEGELPFPPPGDLPDPGIEPASFEPSALSDGFFSTEPLGKQIDEENFHYLIPRLAMSYNYQDTVVLTYG